MYSDDYDEEQGSTEDDYKIYEERKMSEAKQHKWLGHKKKHIPLDHVCYINPVTGRYDHRPRTQQEIEADDTTYTDNTQDEDDEISNAGTITSTPLHTTEDTSLITSYWYDAWDSILDNYNNRHDEWLKTKICRSRTDVARDKIRDISVSLGDKRVAMLHKTLDSYGSTKRAVHQRLFHDKFLVSCLPHIYGDEWQWSRVRVLEKHGLSKIDHETMVITPRRFGKTWAVTMFVAAMLLCCPGITISVLSTGARASTSLKETTVKFIEKSTCHRGKDRVLRSGKELLSVITEQELTNSGGTASKTKGIKASSNKETLAVLMCFPSSSIGKQHTKQNTHAACWERECSSSKHAHAGKERERVVILIKTRACCESYHFQTKR